MDLAQNNKNDNSQNEDNTKINDDNKIKNNENIKDDKKETKEDNQINDNNEINNENENENYDYEDYDNYDYNDENTDNVQNGQEEILETMFINAKNSVNENKLNLYSDIISLDESKEKIWSYKCYHEICLEYLQFEDHLMFPLYYKQLMNAARTFDVKKLRPFVEQTVSAFMNEIKTHCKESINHWLEDLTSDFNRFEQDKVINMFEANINLQFLLLSKNLKKLNERENENNNDYNDYNNNNNNISNIDIDIIDYLNDKEKLERLTNDYLIKECGCNPEYLDKKGNTFFYYQPEDCRRGGENYEVPVGWIGFGIEVTKRYGDTDWISNDGRDGEWAIAYHGFGCRMPPNQIKDIIKTIVHDNLKPGGGQAFSYAPDSRHPGNKCGNGVYITPNLNVATQYAGCISLGGKSYRLVIMVRVNRSFIREPTTQKGYWIVDGKANQLRPYRLLIKEAYTVKFGRF